MQSHIVLYGFVGTDKTHMCVAIDTAACEMSMPVRYFTITKLVMLLSRSREDESLADQKGRRLGCRVTHRCHAREALVPHRRRGRMLYYPHTVRGPVG